MERFTMRPMAFVTTLQPYLMAWVLAISFFITLAVVALISRNRSWKQLALISLGSYLVITTVVLLCTSLVLDIQVMDVEFVYVPPPR